MSYRQLLAGRRPRAVPGDRARVLRALVDDPDVDPCDISVEVERGVIVLDGTVGSHAQRLQAAGVAATALPGIPVENRIRVRPVGENWSIDDATIRREILRELGPLLDPPGDIDIAVEHHVVSLRGRVKDRAARRDIRHTVEHVPGVHLVVNRLEVDEERP